MLQPTAISRVTSFPALMYSFLFIANSISILGFQRTTSWHSTARSPVAESCRITRSRFGTPEADSLQDLLPLLQGRPLVTKGARCAPRTRAAGRPFPGTDDKQGEVKIG